MRRHCLLEPCIKKIPIKRLDVIDVIKNPLHLMHLIFILVDHFYLAVITLLIRLSIVTAMSPTNYDRSGANVWSAMK